jgi:holo-[acyl-carrier protein] synthase
MTVAAGVDLVAVEDVRESLRAHGERYLRRVFTEREIEACGGADAADPRRLAQRFAAKEATAKALRVESDALPWTAIEVLSRPPRGVELALSGAAARLAGERRLSGFHVTMTLEGEMAAAFVVAAGQPT